jgi:ribosomal protein L11 methyltransferase
VLDVGTGTGVLAIAAARALRRPVRAGDIDPVATEAALANARHNRAGAWVRPVTARGLEHPALRADGAYDLVFANILARPLVRLAPSIARAASDDADIVLSGLQMSDVPAVLAAYRAQGLTLARRLGLDGWATLLLRRGGASPRRLFR